jgi:hypothetical protein
MSKRKRGKNHAISTTPRPSTAITPNPPEAPLTLASTGSSGLVVRLLVFGIASVMLVAIWLTIANAQGVWPFDPPEPEPVKKEKRESLTQEELWRRVLSGQLGKRNDWKPEKWQPVTPEDFVIDRFVELHKKGDPAALKLLAPLAAEDAVAADDAEFERRATDHFLRDGGLTIVAIWKGDPDADGRPRPAPGRYTLVTRGSSGSVKVPVRTADGGSLPQRLQLTHPDLVVEVKGGVIHGVRSELHKGP